MEDKITLVITSSNRLDLLRKTIYSFLAYNTYPIEKYILIDDSANKVFHSAIKAEFGAIFEIICNPERIGQIASIDKAYSMVKTPWIFHCEDDWLFYRESFIEASLKLMKTYDKILQVWLRELNDTNGHPAELQLLLHEGIHYRMMAANYLGYHGFSLNPGLRRLSDYLLIAPFSSVKYDKTHPAKQTRYYCPESEISQLYFNMGYRAVILNKGYVKHIGAQARVGWD